MKPDHDSHSHVHRGQDLRILRTWCKRTSACGWQRCPSTHRCPSASIPGAERHTTQHPLRRNMRARLATADPAVNAADALFQRALDFVPAPSRRRPIVIRWRWCVAVAVGGALAADAVACGFGRCGLLRSFVGWDAARAVAAPAPPPCADEPEHRQRPFVVLSAPKSGTTWFRRMLGTHPALSSRGERLLDFSRTAERRNWAAAARHLDAALAEPPPGPKRPGFVLMYEHLPPGSEARFAAWAHCAGAQVVHLIRSSALESYWTLQAEVRDAVDLGRGYVDSSPVDLSAQLRSNRRAIALDAARARAYVKNVEARRRRYRDALKYHRPVEYMEVYYEDLVRADPGSLGRRLHSVQAFLGVDARFSLDANVTWRMHPGACREKIANWDAVARACRGTEAVKACL